MPRQDNAKTAFNKRILTKLMKLNEGTDYTSGCGFQGRNESTSGITKISVSSKPEGISLVLKDFGRIREAYVGARLQRRTKGLSR